MKTIKLLICAAMLSVAFAHMTNAADTTPKSAATISSSGKGDKTIGSESHRWTLGQARKNAHDYADKLDRMTPEQWDAIQKNHIAAFKQWRDRNMREKTASAQKARHQ